MRSISQVTAKESQTEQEVGNRWFDEPFYSSPMWRPTEPNPEKDGDYITRLRSRRKWTMSPKEKKSQCKTPFRNVDGKFKSQFYAPAHAGPFRMWA